MAKDRYSRILEPKKGHGLPEERQQVTVKRRRPPRLTRRQELFVRELVSKDGQITMREAAINAGYSPKSAHVRASELTNPRISPEVCKAIREYRQELDQKYGVEYKRHLRDLQRIRDAALDAGAYSAAVQAEYRRGQAQGDIYVTKTEVRHGSIDQMSKEEVLKALEEIRTVHQPLTFDADMEVPNSRATGRARLKAFLDAEDAEDVEDSLGQPAEDAHVSD